jgi:hypothetical protein
METAGAVVVTLGFGAMAILARAILVVEHPLPESHVGFPVRASDGAPDGSSRASDRDPWSCYGHLLSRHIKAMMGPDFETRDRICKLYGLAADVS